MVETWIITLLDFKDINSENFSDLLNDWFRDGTRPKVIRRFYKTKKRHKKKKEFLTI